MAATLYRVVKDWTATYDNPISVVAGDQIALTGREDIWDGHRWLWAICAAGKEGWVPDCLVANATMTETYSAQELGCTAGQVLTGHMVLHGWVLCTDENGQRGWVPRHNLRKSPTS